MQQFKRLPLWAKAVIAGSVYYGSSELFHTLTERDMKGEVVVITGGGSGIGRLMALFLAKEGCHVAIIDLDFNSASAVVNEIEEAYGGRVKALPYHLDVTNRELVYEVGARIEADFGRVDVLINNAGIVSGSPLLETSDALMEKVVQVNTISHFWTVKAFLPGMLARNHGHIVTVASIAGMAGGANVADYCASKFGAFGFAECLRFELQKLGATGVTTTCVCPYLIDTGMFAGARAGASWVLPILQPAYVASMVVRAIKRKQAWLCLPRIVYLVPLLRVLPVSLYDIVGRLLGSTKTMDNFHQTRRLQQ